MQFVRQLNGQNSALFVAALLLLLLLLLLLRVIGPLLPAVNGIQATYLILRVCMYALNFQIDSEHNEVCGPEKKLSCSKNLCAGQAHHLS